MKNLKSFLMVLALFVLVGGGVTLFSNQNVQANPSRIEHNQTSAATTTGVTISPHATTTLTFLTNGADSADLFMIVKASSSVMALGWTYEYSQNNVDWYSEDYLFDPYDTAIGTVTGSTNTNHNSTTPIHYWQGADGWKNAASTSKKSILNIPISKAEFMRINFFTTVATGTIWFDVITKIQYP